MFNNLDTFAIVLLNMIVRFIFVQLINRFTYFKTESARMRIITISIFGNYFFCYGVV